MESASELLIEAKKLNPSKNRGEFVSLLEKAISQDPDLAEPYLLLGFFYFEKQEMEKAQAYLSKGLTIAPPSPPSANKIDPAEKAYIILGKVYQYLGDKEKSLQCFRSLIELYPDSRMAKALAKQL